MIKVEKKYDQGKKKSNITTGDWVMMNMKDYLDTSWFIVREGTITIFYLFCINISALRLLALRGLRTLCPQSRPAGAWSYSI